MSLVVLKFGGTSLATPARVRRAARRVHAHLRTGTRVVVVVSALGGTTDRILRWLGTVAPGVGPRAGREHDRALATGEDLSAALFAAALQARGINATSMRGGEAGLRAVGGFGQGKLASLYTKRITHLLDSGIVPVVAGFQALRGDGETVTIGRSGSDATAVFLAGVLKADSCHIVTDVEAVCDSDPHKNPNAHPLHQLTHDALVRITESGGEVVQRAAAHFAQQFGALLYVYHYKAPFHPHGTTIGAVEADRRAS